MPESPSSALQTMYFWSAGVPATVFHLMPVGKAAPPAAQSGIDEFLDDGLGRQGQCALESSRPPCAA